jgi:hypothetical protein
VRSIPLPNPMSKWSLNQQTMPEFICDKWNLVHMVNGSFELTLIRVLQHDPECQGVALATSSDYENQEVTGCSFRACGLRMPLLLLSWYRSLSCYVQTVLSTPIMMTVGQLNVSQYDLFRRLILYFSSPLGPRD